ncbi:hypothetical protein BTN50_2112 [Candidatus Enterovibrio altilux]|uniref:Mobile element protein n=1 Tax=Candidatus Enterovibrio altilux TaxID=1927128 RepID=A0A291BBZ1_9GAMM|nr:hypothetical protein BTN50_2112 [Candidatus Enterovibrio luxaltus]
MLPNFLKQTSRISNNISADGAYDTRSSYETVRIKRTVQISIEK